MHRSHPRQASASRWTATGEAFEISDRANKFPPSIRQAVREQTKGYLISYPLSDADVALQQKSADFLLANKVLPNAVDVRKILIRY